MVVETSALALAALLSAVTTAWLRPCESGEQSSSVLDDHPSSESIELLIQPVTSPTRGGSAEEVSSEALPSPAAASSLIGEESSHDELSEAQSNASDTLSPDTPFQTYNFPSTESLPGDESPQHSPQPQSSPQPPQPQPNAPLDADPTPRSNSPPPLDTPEEGYALKLDAFIRERHDFYSPGYIYNIDRLRQEVPPPKELKLGERVAFVRFLRSQPKFHVVSGKTVELTNLTPLRTKGLRALGYFHCVAKYCDTQWESDESFADCHQCCPRCGAAVYPYRQQPLAEDLQILVAIDEDMVCAKGVTVGSASGCTSPPHRVSLCTSATTSAGACRRPSLSSGARSIPDSRPQLPGAELKKRPKPVQTKW